jgi:hypothetical protein
MPKPIYIGGTYKERREVGPRTSKVLRMQKYQGAEIVVMQNQSGWYHDCKASEFHTKWELVKS